MDLIRLILEKTNAKEYVKEKIEDVGQKFDPFFDLDERRAKSKEETKRLVQTVINYADSNGVEGYARKYFGKDAENLEIGDHLWVQRLQYTHHGIYYGEGMVIHYLRSGVTIDTLNTFAEGSVVRRRKGAASPARYSPEEIIRRAQSKIGEDSYNLFLNNCEHFCTWCRNGD